MSDPAKWLTVYLINSAWQIPVLAICTAGLVKAAARGGAKLHYRLWVGCLVLAIVLPALPSVGWVPNLRPHHSAAKTAGIQNDGPAPAANQMDRIAIYSDAIVQPAETKSAGKWLLWLYGLSVLVGMVRLMRKLLVTRRVVRLAQPISLTPEAAGALLQSAKALGVGTVEVYCSASLRCPATVSWPRPMLLVPADFSSVPEDEGAAAISHELAHIRRHDFEVNLVCEMLALVAFYHPAMHWIQRRMAEAREVVCDEMAAEVTTGRTAYAKSLLNLAETVSTQPELRGLSLGVFETGTLEKRIMKLIGERLPWSRGHRVLSVVGYLIVLAALSLGVMALSIRPSAAQATSASTMQWQMGQVFHPTGPLPSFEVATIKPAGPDKEVGGPIMPLSGGPHNGQTIRGYIISAYSFGFPGAGGPGVPYIPQAQVVGGPPWIDKDAYVIQGKVPDELRGAMDRMTLDEQASQYRMMRQSLLADRFKLKVHFEARELPVYELTVAKGGPKLKEVPPPPSFIPGVSRPSPGGPQPQGAVWTQFKGGGVRVFNGRAIPMNKLISSLRLSAEVGGEPIVDKTGLTAYFDIDDLEWAERTSDEANAPSLFTALQEKLGLKLVPAKGPLEVVVIDSIERPSAN